MVNCLKCQHLTEKWKCDKNGSTKGPFLFDKNPCSEYAEVTCDACSHRGDKIVCHFPCTRNQDITHGSFTNSPNMCDCFDRVFAAKEIKGSLCLSCEHRGAVIVHKEAPTGIQCNLKGYDSTYIESCSSYQKPLTAPRPIPTKTTLTCDECPEEKECYLPGCSDEHKQAILKSTWDQAAYETKCRDVFVPALEKEFGITMKQCENPDRTPYWDHFNGDHSNYMQIQSWNGQKATIKLNDYPITATTTAADLIAFFRQYLPKEEKKIVDKCKECKLYPAHCSGTTFQSDCEEFERKGCSYDSCTDKTQCSPCSEKPEKFQHLNPSQFRTIVEQKAREWSETQLKADKFKQLYGLTPQEWANTVLGLGRPSIPSKEIAKTEEESVNTEIKGTFDGEIECPKCKAKNPAAAKFCCLCGKKVKKPKIKKIKPLKVPKTKPEIDITKRVVKSTPPNLRELTDQEIEFNAQPKIYGVGCNYCKYGHSYPIPGPPSYDCKKYENYNIGKAKICDSFTSLGRYCKQCHIFHDHFKCPLCHRR